VPEPLEELVAIRPGLELEDVVEALLAVIDLVRKPADSPVVGADERAL
jgi:hypothetical protein